MKKGLLSITIIFLIMGCGGKGGNPKPAPVTPPSISILTAPAQNAVCTTGTIVSDSISTITFTWNASANTDSYELYLKNLLTGITNTQTTSQTQLSINLLRNTPYSWYIVSSSTKTSTTAQSAVWKFYNAGAGVVSYAPFPADITSPVFAQAVTAPTGTVNLAWTGSAVINGTIANYDVYFGTGNTPALLQGTITNSFLNNVAVVSKTTYYWKVITRDIFGNTSDSGLYQFSVN